MQFEYSLFLGDLDDLDVHPLTTNDHPIWSNVWLAYDPGERYDWPRQRSHYVMSRPIDDWQVVAEVQSFDGHHPDRDHLKSATFVNAVIQPHGQWPVHHERIDRAKWNNEWIALDPSDAVYETEDGPEEMALAHSSVGIKPTSAPSSAALKALSRSNIADAEKLVVAASQCVAEVDILRGWYRLPTPRTTPTKRGLGGRNIREFAELANLFIYAAEQDPAAPVKWLANEFSYTGYPSTWWHQIGNSLAKKEFISDRRWGLGGGKLTQRTLDELAAHRRP